MDQGDDGQVFGNRHSITTIRLAEEGADILLNETSFSDYAIIGPD